MLMKALKRWMRQSFLHLVLVLMGLIPPLASSVYATVVRDLRVGDQHGYIRIVIESDRPISPDPAVAVHENRLIVSLKGIINTFPAPRHRTLADIRDIDVSAKAGDTAIGITFEFTPNRIQTFTLTGPHRFIIDVYRPIDPSASDPTHLRQGDPVKDVAHASTSGQPADVTVPAPRPEKTGDTHADGNTPVNRWPFKENLIVALILVTSLIAILLIWLIRLSNRKKMESSAWQEDLPPERDTSIEDLDAQIREQLKSYKHM
jgi:hypothetical protein